MFSVQEATWLVAKVHSLPDHMFSVMVADPSDGYTSLLTKSEGGTAEVVIDEENGILIAIMLRQYFMALKVIDRWKNWGASMDRHWGNVVSSVDYHHPHHQPSPACAKNVCDWKQPTSLSLASGWEEWTATKLRERRASVTPLNEHVAEETHVGDDEAEVENIDRELRIMRRVFRKWSHRAGVHGRVCDELKEGEYEADWTKAIAPKLEGRIQMVESGKT